MIFEASYTGHILKEILFLFFPQKWHIKINISMEMYHWSFIEKTWEARVNSEVSSYF